MTWTPRSDWINVKTDVNPPAFGDGIIDDTNAQSALDLASSNAASSYPNYANKVTVYLPPGTYKITNTIAWSGMKGLMGPWLVGCGSNTTISWAGSVGGTTP